MGCWDVNPRKSPPTKEEIDAIIKATQEFCVVVKENRRAIPEGSMILVDYLSLMK